MASNFRTLYQWTVPRWLNDGDGGSRVLHALAWMIDASLERVYQGLAQRFPAYASEDALRRIGRDRLIPRGRVESSTSYAKRLTQWRGLYGHKTRGNAPALLRQICEYFGGVAVWMVDRAGNRDMMDADRVWSYSTAFNWEWDARPRANDWGRFWVVLEHTTQTDWYDKLAIQKLLYGAHPWRPVGVQPEWVIFVGPGSAPAPDGSWDHWSYEEDGGSQLPRREPTYRYWSLAPWYNNTFTGDPALFCVDALLPEDVAGTEGDPEAFPTSVDVFGAPYAGNPALFATTIQLPDDGDIQWHLSQP